MLPSTKALPQVVTSDLFLQAVVWKGKKVYHFLMLGVLKVKLVCQKRLSVLKATHRAMKASEIHRVDEEGVE